MKPNNEVIDEIIQEQLGEPPERITPDANLVMDLGVDSLDIVELVMAFEEAFDREPQDEDVEKWRTVGDIHRYYEGVAQNPTPTFPTI